MPSLSPEPEAEKGVKGKKSARASSKGSPKKGKNADVANPEPLIVLEPSTMLDPLT